MASKVQGSSSMKALVVEDNTVQRMVLSMKLRNFECEITHAMNGKEAVDLFLEGKKFDIIFCDKDMPIMTGPEAVVKIHAMGETDVKIVGMSADDDAMEVFISAGADVFVPKPINVQDLKSIIKEVINKKKNTMV
ncbi:two-component response regulator ORR42-like [Triticum dicoccoides]|uniref:two-component response regulator ORR42-like n=1 Tax=Triticum dicoccoides TaxID=85692 RepID=UPI000E7883E0|nr:two-component response regulator ORR42-like [Triticum dicoccoides]